MFKPELLSPAGTLKNMRYAFAYGADAVYAGQPRYSLRVRNNEFNHENLQLGINEAHALGKKFYVVVNIAPHNAKLKTFIRDLKPVVEMGPDALIMSDPGLIMLVREHFPEMPIHLSVQANAVNWATVKFWQQMGLTRVILSRELSLEEIEEIRNQVPDMEIEIFVHGALCMAVSGKCYLSLHETGCSANRGACRQICRRKYTLTDVETGAQLAAEGQYLLSPKDLCTIDFLDRFVGAGVRVLKIEGRARGAEYVRRVVACYDRALRAMETGEYTPELAAALKEELATVFNRGFWQGYYAGAPMAEHSEHYGSSATRRKVYVGRVTNFFKKQSVAEVWVEASPVRRGDELFFQGPTTGVVELTADPYVGNAPAQEAVQGVFCSLKTPSLVRRGDQLYRMVPADASNSQPD